MPAATEKEIVVSLPSTALASATACTVAAHYMGTGANARVVTSLYFDVRPNPHRTFRETDPAMIAALNQVYQGGLVPDPSHVKGSDLDRLAREGRLPRVRPTLARPLAFTPQSGPTDEEVIGQSCRPGELPPRPGISCRPADGEWTTVPARVANAVKGDILLMPGCGFIGGLLRRLDPPQRYSHEYLMTNNFYDMVHSTSSKDYYKYNPAPGGTLGQLTEGVREDALKYGWPGILQQDVHHALFGEQFEVVSPGGSASTYSISGFNPDPERCEGDIDISNPLVIRPPPGTAETLRTQLHAAADKAAAMRGHYRFFAYSDGAIGLNPAYNAPETVPIQVTETLPDGTTRQFFDDLPHWAAGTRATVSSQFIWIALKEAGFTLEGDALEPDDVAAGARVDPSTAAECTSTTKPNARPRLTSHTMTRTTAPPTRRAGSETS